jgi:hypothetical protein
MKQRMTNDEKAIYYREFKQNKYRQKKLTYYHSISNIINDKIRRVEEESTAKTYRKKRKTEKISKGIQTETETKSNRSEIKKRLFRFECFSKQNKLRPCYQQIKIVPSTHTKINEQSCCTHIYLVTLQWHQG